MRVVFNVCGTRYESTVSVIESKPDTMLAMLLRHHNPEQESEIFVQGDPIMFRWILYYYTRDILVDEDTVGVPKEVWDAEIDFYTLLSKEEEEEVEKEKEEASKKRPFGVEIDEEHELASLAKKHMKETSEKEKTERTNRLTIYKNMLEHFIPRLSQKKNVRTSAEFIGRSANQKPIIYPIGFPDNLKGIDFDVVDKHFAEFQEYCGKIGFILTKEGYYPSSIARNSPYALFPHDVKTAHQSMTISLHIK